MRKAYIDNIRWATVWLVLIYHVCYMFNGVGILGGIPGAENVPAFDTAVAMVYPWFMVLLLLLAGMSARYSLSKRTGGQFIRERAVKLLVPSTLGLFVIHWITGYLNIKMGGGLDFIPAPLVYPISAISGIGPLWFIQTLFLFSCVLVLLKKLDGRDRLWELCGRCGLPMIILLALPIFVAAQVLNMPVLTMYRFGIYFVAFLIGYFVFSHDGVQEKVERARVPMLCAAAVCAVVYAFQYHGTDYTSPDCLQSVITNLYLWFTVLAIIGFAKRYMDRETDLTRYMSSSSFGVYILHYPVLLAICYVICTYFSFPAICNYLLALVIAMVLTPLAYELISRIPVIRWLVLGRRK